jgi:hypothetical protein
MFSSTFLRRIEITLTVAGKNGELSVRYQVIAGLGVDGSTYRSDRARTGPGCVLDPYRLRRTPGSNFNEARHGRQIRTHLRGR